MTTALPLGCGAIGTRASAYWRAIALPHPLHIDGGTLRSVGAGSAGAWAESARVPLGGATANPGLMRAIVRLMVGQGEWLSHSPSPR